ncbi:MAG: hypothetical protein MI748_03035 [Opitutales bacterium]|nr:hypothetical protein [Opitutales bacterium]
MWKTIISILAITTLAAAQAHAGHRSSSDSFDAAIGGFITGVVLSEVFDDSNVSVHLTSRGCRDSGRSYRRYDSWSRYDSRYRDYSYGRHRDYGRSHHYNKYSSRDGYYTYRKQKVWIPGHWEYVRKHCGRKVKVWVDGHYEWRKIKVWVPGRYGRNGCY